MSNNNSVFKGNYVWGFCNMQNTKVMQIIVEIRETVQGIYSAKWQRNPIP